MLLDLMFLGNWIPQIEGKWIKVLSIMKFLDLQVPGISDHLNKYFNIFDWSLGVRVCVFFFSSFNASITTEKSRSKNAKKSKEKRIKLTHTKKKTESNFQWNLHKVFECLLNMFNESLDRYWCTFAVIKDFIFSTLCLELTPNSSQTMITPLCVAVEKSII